MLRKGQESWAGPTTVAMTMIRDPTFMSHMTTSPTATKS